MGRWRTGLAHRSEKPRTPVRLGLVPPTAAKQHPLYKIHGDV